jgi:hypothetical protein
MERGLKHSKIQIVREKKERKRCRERERNMERSHKFTDVISSDKSSEALTGTTFPLNVKPNRHISKRLKEFL